MERVDNQLIEWDVIPRTMRRNLQAYQIYVSLRKEAESNKKTTEEVNKEFRRIMSEQFFITSRMQVYRILRDAKRYIQENKHVLKHGVV